MEPCASEDISCAPLRVAKTCIPAKAGPKGVSILSRLGAKRAQLSANPSPVSCIAPRLGSQSSGICHKLAQPVKSISVAVQPVGCKSESPASSKPLSSLLAPLGRPGAASSTPPLVLSLLRHAYGPDQVGAADERLKGFDLREEDAESDATFDLTYGELLPHGASKALGPKRLLPSTQARTLLDLGMGSGKFAMQAFFEADHLVHVVGVELTHARFDLAAQALKRLAAKPAQATNNALFEFQESKDANCKRTKWMRLVDLNRVLEFRRGDIFNLPLDLIARADAIIMAVAFPPEMIGRVQKLLCHTKPGCRLLTYEDLNLDASHTWDPPAPRAFQRLPCNNEDDRYRVSWLPRQGYRFNLHEVKTRASIRSSAAGSV